MINISHKLPNTLSPMDLVVQSSSLMVMTDYEDHFIAVSQGVASLCGYPSIDRMVGTTNHDLPCGAVKLADDFKAANREVFTKQQPSRFLCVSTYSDNDFHAMLGERSPLFNPDNPNEVVACLTNAFEISNGFILECSIKLSMVDRYFHGRSSDNIYKIAPNNLPYNLTKKEHECLFLLVRGKTASEIALMLNVSKRTIETHIENIKNKFGCTKKSELIEKAIAVGYVTLLPEFVMHTNIIFPV